MRYLTPVFCGRCRNRIGWTDEGDVYAGLSGVFCDNCVEEVEAEIAKEEVEASDLTECECEV